MREEPQGGARSPYAAMALWQRDAAAGWTGRPVIGLMVNGAQGDDDEAHGGHFAIVTGCGQADGAIGNWLVNNFYSLDVESEKGIIAAPVPLDNYLADLNSGQGWYRPSTMVLAVLGDERAAALLQSALNRVFNQFYRHQLVYYHPNQNCASISIDTLRALGWQVPARGPTSRAFGHAPAMSTWDYCTLVPSDPAMAQIVPVPPRPLPSELRDADLLPAPWTPADHATWVWGLVAIAVLPLLLWAWWRRRLKRGAAEPVAVSAQPRP